ncbi:hypothetical protein AVEN_192783-1 [Araneus ventricosus]|uniref:DDE-1 domain-containing protein n=1 Tax=Araneus ventricosus TaxID=182803 RepID=A0A4Y2CSQ5_ARAVE|nr:hypothetical protein AVEN_192783-1 [Araneus ventricosus]
MGCSIEKPAVIFIDNHKSRLGIEVIDEAHENGLSIITYPPHTSHKLQPLDVSVAFYKALSLENISSGFKRTGIWPINLDIFSDREFEASGVFMIDNTTLILDVSNSVHKEKNPLDYEDYLNEPSTSAKHSTANVIDRNFSEIVAIRPLPKRKAEERFKRRKRGTDVGCKLITSTPEKINALEKEKLCK